MSLKTMPLKAMPLKTTPLKVLTVCLGNICRSPAAQGILQFKANERKIKIDLDSAGTAAYHIGNQPDSRSISELAKRSIDISLQQARQVSLTDFEDFDWILAMDNSNLQNLISICPSELQYKVQLFGAFNGHNRNHITNLGEVADPYYGEEDGFAVMADHLESLADAFFDAMKSKA